MSTLDCTPNFITAKSVENARKDTSMERVVGSDLETDSELSFFWDEPDSISSVETKKLHHLLKRNSVKKSNSTPVKMSVQNIPHHLNTPEACIGSIRSTPNATKPFGTGPDLSRDPVRRTWRERASFIPK